MNDLSKKINFYKVNHKIRNKIAKKGQEKYLKYFNSNKIANFIIDKSMNFKKKNKYFWE
jgi:spore maturation protein CgeB